MTARPGRSATLLLLALVAAAGCGPGAGATESHAAAANSPDGDCAALAAHFRPLAERDAARPPVRMRPMADSTPLPIAGDLVALDGTRALYFDDRGLEVVDTAHDRLTPLGRIVLKDGADRVLVLPHHRVVATGSYGEWRDGAPNPIPHAVISEIDLSDPAHPHLLRTETVDGSVLGASAVGGVARIVITSPSQLISRSPQADETDAQVQDRNLRAVRAARGEDYLPHRQVTDASGKVIADGPLLGCADLARPNAPHALGTTTVLSVDPSAATPALARGVADVAEFLQDAGQRIELGVFDRSGAQARSTGSSTLYSLDGTTGAIGHLIAAGSVPGDIADNEAISAGDGVVRVVLGVSPGRAYPPGRTGNRRGVAILREQAGQLQLVGHVGTGSGDLVKRVSWVDDLAVFEDSKGTDYVVDTTDPGAPRLRAAVKLPGHVGSVQSTPGRQAFVVGPDGSGSTLKTSTRVGFLDLRDPDRPQLIGQVSLGRGASNTAPAAMGWFPGLKLAVVPLTTTQPVGPPQCPLLKGRPSCSTDIAQAVLVRVGANGSLRVLGTVKLHGFQRRFMAVGNRVLAITDQSVVLLDSKKAAVLDELRHPIYKQRG